MGLWESELEARQVTWHRHFQQDSQRQRLQVVNLEKVRNVHRLNINAVSNDTPSKGECIDAHKHQRSAASKLARSNSRVPTASASCTLWPRNTRKLKPLHPDGLIAGVAFVPRNWNVHPSSLDQWRSSSDFYVTIKSAKHGFDLARRALE